jgi:pimeloyl-ACP methyl ester carboxylesterase
MLEMVPDGVRAIAITQRGLGESTPLEPDVESKVSPRELYDTLVNDLLVILKTIRDMGVEKCIILAQSMSCAIATGLLTPEHLPSTSTLLPYLQGVIFWDPPLMGVHGLPPTPIAMMNFKPENFIDYITGFYNYHEEYLVARIPGKSEQVFETEKTTLDDPDYSTWAEKAVDLRSPWPNILPCISNDRTKLGEKSREGHNNLAELDVEKSILYGIKACQENLEGCWTSRDWIEEVGGNCQVFPHDR